LKHFDFSFNVVGVDYCSEFALYDELDDLPQRVAGYTLTGDELGLNDYFIEEGVYSTSGYTLARGFTTCGAYYSWYMTGK